MAKNTKSGVEESIVAVAGGKEFKILQKEMQNAVNALRAEARLAEGANKVRALTALRQLQEFKKVRGSKTLNSGQAKELLRAVAQTREATAEVIRKNSKETVGGKTAKGVDGKTMTERMRDENQEIASRDKLVELLAAINDHKEKAGKKQELLSRQLKTTLRQGLSAFLGPAGPLIETFAELKDEYGDSAKDMGKRFVKWIRGDKDLVAALEKNGKQEQSRGKRLMSVLSDGFKRMGSGLGSGLLGLLNWAWKGAWSLAKRIAQPLIRGVISVASKLSSAAVKFLPKLAAGAMKRLPVIGSILGAYGLSQTEEAKGSDTTADKAMAYGQGAADGALTGAALGSFIPGLGTAVGAVIGAAGGLALTAVLRNKQALVKSGKEAWSTAGDYAKAGINSATAGLGYVANYVTTFLSDMRSGFDTLHKWLIDNIPFYGKAVNAAKTGVESVKTTGAAVAGAAVSAANVAATTVGQIGSGAAIATQSAVNAVSTKVGGLAQTLPDGSGAKAIATGIGAASSSIANFAGKLAMPGKEVQTAITEASDKTGVDKGYMMAMTAQESGFNTMAKATTSSAKGLNQFLDGTWKGMVDKYGAQYGIGMKDQYDPKKNALMGALFAKDNAATLQRQGHDASATNLYAAHMLGSGGANTLLSAAKTNGGQAADVLFPKGAKANKHVFYNKDGSAKTVAQVVDFYKDKIETKAGAYNKNMATATASVAPTASGYERVSAQTPGANVTVATPTNVENAPGGQQSNISGYGGANYSMTDMPFVLGDNNMVVVNAGMMGA